MCSMYNRKCVIYLRSICRQQKRVAATVRVKNSCRAPWCLENFALIILNSSLVRIHTHIFIFYNVFVVVLLLFFVSDSTLRMRRKK